MVKYVSKYKVFAPLDLSANKVTTNTNDTYLLGKHKIQCYRQDENVLALYFPSSESSVNLVLPQLDLLGIKYELHISGDFESVYFFDEKDLNGVNSVLGFKVKGKTASKKSA